jgi:hypothetical protein
MKKIWTDDVVEFKGKYYDIPPSRIEPKSNQKPHIPIYLGGFSPNTFSRIAKYDRRYDDNDAPVASWLLQDRLFISSQEMFSEVKFL